MEYGYQKMDRNMMDNLNKIWYMEMEYIIVKKGIFKEFGNIIYQLKLLKLNYTNE